MLHRFKKFIPAVTLLAGLVAATGLYRTIAGPTLALADAGSPAAAPTAAAPTEPTPGPRVDDPKAVYRVPLEDSPLRGAREALVTIVEVSDFECPFCKRAAPTMKQVEKAYAGKVRFAFKHNPLPFHKAAVPAALVAEEARLQGGDEKFWLAHDKFFEQAQLDAASLVGVARELGLAEEQLKAALTAGDRHLARIGRDQALVTSLGATGTPTFFINGRKLVGALPFEAFKPVIDEELKKAEALVRAGVAPKDVYARIIEKGATAPVTMAGPPVAPALPVKVALRADDPAIGPASARVTVVEFSDFQCPFCSRAVPAVKELEQAFGKEVRVVWKHLPLPFHQEAMPAALAAEAAREQGKFWEMHDKLFASQQALSEASYAQFAADLKLDLPRFRASRMAAATRQRVEADLAAASAAGVDGTPTFVVNGELVVGSAALKPAVERQLKKSRLASK